jgi:hypothetical protein
MTTPLANTRVNYQANSTTDPQTNATAAQRWWQGRQGGDEGVVIIIVIVK